MIDQYPSPSGVLTSLIWRKTMSGGETSLSGYDNANQALSYTPGQEQVYLNGILLVRGDDYTATNGTSITGLSALSANDFIQINCYNNFSVASTPATSITGTITSSQVDSTIVTTTGSQTLTNKTLTTPTLTTPRFGSAGEIDDTNGNELIKFPTTVASAINEITVTNAAASSTPSISATGDDTNISLNLVAKGSGTVQAGGVPVVTTTGSQTLTNKTLTSPTITGASGVINNTLTTTTGDIIYASGANTPARLGIGSSGQVLTVSGGVPAWATASSGGFTQLTSATNIGSVSSFTINITDQTYKDIRIILREVRNAGGSLRMSFNNTTDTGYAGGFFDYRATFQGFTRTNSGKAYFNVGDQYYPNTTYTAIINLPDYSSQYVKFSQFYISGQDAGSGADGGTWGWSQKGFNGGITSVILSHGGTNFTNGTFEVWGIK